MAVFPQFIFSITPFQYLFNTLTWDHTTIWTELTPGFHTTVDFKNVNSLTNPQSEEGRTRNELLLLRRESGWGRGIPEIREVRKAWRASESFLKTGTPGHPSLGFFSGSIKPKTEIRDLCSLHFLLKIYIAYICSYVAKGWEKPKYPLHWNYLRSSWSVFIISFKITK